MEDATDWLPGLLVMKAAEARAGEPIVGVYTPALQSLLSQTLPSADLLDPDGSDAGEPAQVQAAMARWQEERAALAVLIAELREAGVPVRLREEPYSPSQSVPPGSLAHAGPVWYSVFEWTGGVAGGVAGNLTYDMIKSAYRQWTARPSDTPAPLGRVQALARGRWAIQDRYGVQPDLVAEKQLSDETWELAFLDGQRRYTVRVGSASLKPIEIGWTD